MGLQGLQGAFILLQICCLLALTVAVTRDEQQLSDVPLIQGIPIISSQARTARIAEFVSSHKIPDNINHKDARLLDRIDRENEEEEEDKADTDLGNYGNSRLFYEDEVPLRRTLSQQSHHYSSGKQNLRDRDETFSGVRVSHENPTTMLPILTTQRDNQLFDFVPVNIIREDAKGNPFAPFDNKNFEDLGDISLVPAGSNTRIQVKKGPNGKDYEYEYVYYYYDEEDEGKGGATASNSQEAPTRTSAPTSNSGTPPRRSNPNRNKYSTLDRTTTIEPVINEVIPSGNGSRARQLDNINVDISEERLPTNTRFPPRSRVNQAADTTERVNRVRGNRQRTTLDSIDSSSFRGQQEGPEFPQNLPNGPVRFLGVTPNEGSEDKTTSRVRNRPQKVQEPAPVHESYEDPTYTRKRPNSDGQEKIQLQTQTQFRQHPYSSKDDEFSAPIPMSSTSRNLPEDRDFYTDLITEVTDSPTTQVPQAMDKVALDLYAFLQQGRSNLVDFVKDIDDDSSTTEPPFNFGEITTMAESDIEDYTSTAGPPTTTPTTTSTSTTTTPATTTTTTTTTAAPPSSTEEANNVVPALGRGKFRRPTVGGPVVSRNRFKSGAILPNSNSAEPKPTEPSSVNSSTQKIRGRFGQASGNGGFKRARPSGHKQSQQPSASLDEQVQKESADKVIVEGKPGPGRGRFRGAAARSGSQAKTTSGTLIRDKVTTTTGNPSSLGPVHRPGGFNKLSPIARRRGNRPAVEQNSPSSEQTTSSVSPGQESSSNEQQRPLSKLPTIGLRPKPLNKPIIKPGAGRLNLRPRPGQSTPSSTAEAVAVDAASSPPTVEAAADEPASEGTEEETREAPVESSPAARPVTVNPLNKLRNRNRIQVQPKTTTARTPLPPASRRSPLLLPRRKTTETPIEVAEPVTDAQLDAAPASDESETTQSSPSASEANIPITLKHEESSKSLSSLLTPRRRIALRRPGQPISLASE
ncbi:PREDICTED: mucin-17 isoform X2 [Ceratosolen solmsi marchali]|uniref:Mucin-17 isoform X2 n=1 Tax=Ceratosolen solmsi marchali TaxID=326594 RepID=A0AAJ6VML6_9HYME|nr:PREDICTED: mucin-17 isoform X2 [Ceratosolen solmsi marchali]